MPLKPAGRAIRGFVGPVAVLAAAALGLTACSSSDHAAGSGNAAAASSASGGSTASAAPGGNGSSAAPDSAGDGSAVASSDPDTTGSTGSSTAGISTKSTATGTGCASSQLKVTRKDEGAGAGSAYSVLVFTNVSGTTCTLTGYPGVSYVAAAGVQSGNAAQRDGSAYSKVTLKPGGTAGARVRDANGLSGYSPAQCQLTSVQGLRIYPPNRKAALFLPWKTQHCAGSTVHALTVGPVQPNAHW